MRAKDLPPNCSCADVKIKGDAEEGKITLKISEKTPPGKYTFWLQNETKIKWTFNPQALEREQKYLAALKSPKVSLDKQMLAEEIAEVEKRITELKKTHTARDYTAWLPSQTIQVTVLKAD